MHTILVVEDDPLVRLHISGALEDEGYAVMRAGSGQEALTLLDERDGVDLVISDVRLGHGIDGLQLTEEIRDRWPGVAVVIASGMSAADLQLPDHATLLRKPFGVGALLAACRKGCSPSAEMML